MQRYLDLSHNADRVVAVDVRQSPIVLLASGTDFDGFALVQEANIPPDAAQSPRLQVSGNDAE